MPAINQVHSQQGNHRLLHDGMEVLLMLKMLQ